MFRQNLFEFTPWKFFLLSIHKNFVPQLTCLPLRAGPFFRGGCFPTLVFACLYSNLVMVTTFLEVAVFALSFSLVYIKLGIPLFTSSRLLILKKFWYFLVFALGVLYTRLKCTNVNQKIFYVTILKAVKGFMHTASNILLF